MMLITIMHKLIKNFANSKTLEIGGGKGLPFTNRIELRSEFRALLVEAKHYTTLQHLLTMRVAIRLLIHTPRTGVGCNRVQVSGSELSVWHIGTFFSLKSCCHSEPDAFPRKDGDSFQSLEALR